MEIIENAAFVSIGRACGFMGLAIFCVMAGLAFDPSLSARTGGWLCLATAAYLAVCAWRARTRPYKRTETWLLLRKEHRPPAAIAQRIIGEALRETYLWFAKHAAAIAAVLLVLSVIIQLAGIYRAPAQAL